MELQSRFRQFWMTSVADGFKEDLEEIRKVSRYFCLDKNAYYVADMSHFFFLGT